MTRTTHRITEPKRRLLATRAAASLSTTPRPFLKWAGSKRRFLPDILPHVPSRFHDYYEPFLGGGALFFLLQPTSAFLSDTCAELIDTYRAVRDAPSAIYRHLEPLRPDPDLYYAIRSRRSPDRIARAADFMYLNKMCWNGLYRVNQNGHFNVPYGRPRSAYIADEPNLQSCSAALRAANVSLAAQDFRAALSNVTSSDLVFLDPPYVNKQKTRSFVDYNETLFSWRDQEVLAGIVRSLCDRGAHVLLTNADHPSIRDLYYDFPLYPLRAHSTISGKRSGRRIRSELLIVGSTPAQD